MKIRPGTPDSGITTDDDVSDDEFFDAYDSEENLIADGIVKEIASLPINDTRLGMWRREARGIKKLEDISNREVQATIVQLLALDIETLKEEKGKEALKNNALHATGDHSVDKFELISTISDIERKINRDLTNEQLAQARANVAILKNIYETLAKEKVSTKERISVPNALEKIAHPRSTQAQLEIEVNTKRASLEKMGFPPLAIDKKVNDFKALRAQELGIVIQDEVKMPKIIIVTDLTEDDLIQLSKEQLVNKINSLSSAQLNNVVETNLLQTVVERGDFEVINPLVQQVSKKANSHKVNEALEQSLAQVIQKATKLSEDASRSIKEMEDLVVTLEQRKLEIQVLNDKILALSVQEKQRIYDALKTGDSLVGHEGFTAKERQLLSQMRPLEGPKGFGTPNQKLNAAFNSMTDKITAPVLMDIEKQKKQLKEKEAEVAAIPGLISPVVRTIYPKIESKEAVISSFNEHQHSMSRELKQVFNSAFRSQIIAPKAIVVEAKSKASAEHIVVDHRVGQFLESNEQENAKLALCEQAVPELQRLQQLNAALEAEGFVSKQLQGYIKLVPEYFASKISKKPGEIAGITTEIIKEAGINEAIPLDLHGMAARGFVEQELTKAGLKPGDIKIITKAQQAARAVDVSSLSADGLVGKAVTPLQQIRDRGRVN